MDKRIAFCGLDCGKCDAFVALKNNDQNLRETAAKKWEKLYNHPNLKPEDINCAGCTYEGIHFKNCDVCDIRKCATEKNVESCAQCDQYGCDRLKDFHKRASDAKKNLEYMRK